MEVANKLKESGLDDEFGIYYDLEIVHRKEGASNEKKSIAKTMLSKKMDIPLISELTGLSKKQIKTLL